MVDDSKSSLIDFTEVDGVIDRLFHNSRNNALIAWGTVIVLISVFVDSLLDGDLLWMVFVAFVGFIVVIPPIVFRDWQVMLPWELLVLAELPILVRGLLGGTVGTFATYIAISGLALLVIVELHMFTSLRVTPWFAVTIVTMATLATVAVWSIFRWNADIYLGTNYLVDNRTLMIEWLYVTIAGIIAGGLFEIYFSRRDQILWNALRRLVER